MYDFVTIAEALSAAADKEALLIDVRQEEDYRCGHLPFSVNIPLAEFMKGTYRDHQDFAAFAVRREKKGTGDKIIVYCETGTGSVLAAGKLDRDGFDAFSISGGVSHYRGKLERSAEPGLGRGKCQQSLRTPRWKSGMGRT